MLARRNPNRAPQPCRVRWAVTPRQPRRRGWGGGSSRRERCSADGAALGAEAASTRVGGAQPFDLAPQVVDVRELRGRPRRSGCRRPRRAPSARAAPSPRSRWRALRRCRSARSSASTRCRRASICVLADRALGQRHAQLLAQLGRIELLAPAVLLDDDQPGALDPLVGREAAAAGDALPPAADDVAAAQLAAVDDPGIAGVAEGAAHGERSASSGGSCSRRWRRPPGRDRRTSRRQLPSLTH